MNERASTTAAGADLPRWDLSDLFPGPDSTELKSALAAAADGAKAFAAAHRGALAGLDGARLGAAVVEYERLQDLIGRIGSYAQLLYAGDMSDPEITRFYQTIQERLTDISSELLFFTLELNRIDDAALAETLKAPELARYAPFLRDTRAFRPHQLTDDLEKLLHEKQVVGRAAWNRLFDETMAALRFPVDGKELTSSDALNLLTDRDGETRRKAGQAGGPKTVLAGHMDEIGFMITRITDDGYLKFQTARPAAPERCVWRRQCAGRGWAAWLGDDYQCDCT